MSVPPDDLAERLLHHRAWLRALARELVGESGAEDVVQETWAAALAHPPGGPLRPWLAAVARRAALFVRRGDAARRSREERAARPEATRSTDDLIERVDAEERLVRELRALDEPFRTTLLRRYWEGLSAAAIARADGVPEGTVRWRAKRGLDELRARLERAFGGREAFGAALVPLARGGTPAGTTIAAGAAAGGAIAMIGGKWLVGTCVVLTLVGAAIGVERWRASAAVGAVARDEVAPLHPAEAPRTAGEEAAEVVPEQGGTGREPGRADSSGPLPALPARLRILEWDRSAHAGKTVLVRTAAAADPTVLGTDDAGRLELPPGAGACELVIERAGAFAHRATVAPDAGEQELVLPEEVVIEGRVVVDGGAPIRPVALELFPAASVEERTYADPAQPLVALELDLVRTRTDGEGRFRVRGARSDHGYNVRLPAGYVQPGTWTGSSWETRVQFHLPRPARGVVLEVQRLPSLVGRLVEADGRTPTAGLVDCRWTWANGTNMDAGARTDEDGWFELSPDEPWRSIALDYWGAPGTRGRMHASFERADVPENGLLGDLRLASGHTVVLRVVDPDGNPLAGARTDLESAPTDEHGETSLPDVTAASVRVVARGHRETRVALPPGAATVEAILARAPELFLEVRDRRGVPVGDLAVELRASRGLFEGSPSMLLSSSREGRLVTWDRPPFAARYTVNEVGMLRADSLLPGIPFELRVLAWGGVVHEGAQAGLGADEWRRVVVEVDAEVVELAGRVLDEEGLPVKDAALALPSIRSGGWTHFLSRRTDSDGRFRCAVLDLPGLRLTVRRPGYLPLVRELAHVPAEELELVLEPGLDVRVMVLDERGGPQGGGNLSVRGPSVPSIHEESPGRFLARELRDGRHEFVLRIGGAEFVRAHEAHEPELTFRVPTMGGLESRWELPRRAETTDFITLELRAAPDGRLALQQGFHDTPAGEHRFEPVVPGAYELVLKTDTESGELVLARGSVEVVAGETARVALTP